MVCGDRIMVDSEVIYPKGSYGYLTWVRGEILGSPAFGKEFLSRSLRGDVCLPFFI